MSLPPTLQRAQAAARLLVGTSKSSSLRVAVRNRSTAALAVADEPIDEAGPSTFHRAAQSSRSPVTKGKERERVAFSQSGAGVSVERRTYFAGSPDDAELAVWGDAEVGESLPGLEAGRVVECRRYVYIKISDTLGVNVS